MTLSCQHKRSEEGRLRFQIACCVE